MIKYTLNGETFDVDPQNETQFKIDNPEAKIVEEPGKDQGANPPQNNQQENTGFSSEDGSSEPQSSEGFKPFELKKPQLQTEIEEFSSPESKAEFEIQEGKKNYYGNTEIKDSLEKGPDFINSTPNEVLTYENAPEWFDNRAVLHENYKWNDKVKDDVYSGKFGYNPSTGALIKLNKDIDVPEEIQEYAEPVEEGYDYFKTKKPDLENITHYTDEEFNEIFGLSEDINKDYNSSKIPVNKYEDVVNWFNSENGYYNRGLRLNFSSKEKYGKVELLKRGQEEGSGTTFNMSDPEFYNNIKAQINVMANPDNQKEAFDYLGDLISPELLKLTDNDTGYFPANRKLFKSSMDLINATIASIPYESDREKEILNALPKVDLSQAEVGTLSAPTISATYEYKDPRVDWSKISEEEIAKMKKDPAYNF